jgi:HD superfamily phosphodiesterase
MEHMLRQCLIALRLAERVGLDVQAASRSVLPHHAGRQRSH